MQPLLNYAANVTSQNGEDGILTEIFCRIGHGNKACIEFGAWDGKHLSNSWNLWSNCGWNAMLIEGDEIRFTELLRATASNGSVTPVKRFVVSEGKDSLNEIVSEFGFSSTPDLLSIDIDGDDIAIFESLTTCIPRVVVIEYNSTFPTNISFRQRLGGKLGASAKAILEVAGAKGYKLAHITDTNLILVVASEFDKLGFQELQLPEVYPITHLSYVVMSYDGEAYLLKERLPYHPSRPPRGVRRLVRLLAKALFKRDRSTSDDAGLYPIEVLSK